jgi:guanylate kinase
MVKGKLNIISGPSGAGKSTLIKRFLKEYPEFIFPTSVTTRKPREGEINGDHYIFLNEDEFLKKKNEEELLEWADVYGMYYGTLKSTILNGLDEGKKFIKDIDVQGANALMDILDNKLYTSVFISPPSIQELKQRLLNRGSEAEEQLQKRVDAALQECEQAHHFDYEIINEDLEKAYAEFCNILLET